MSGFFNADNRLWSSVNSAVDAILLNLMWLITCIPVVTIGAAQVSASEMALDEIPPREQKVKEIRTTVASMRLDVIAAAGFGTSRSKMANEIDVDKVKVNWKDVKSSSQAIKEGDIISLRGRGRVEVAEVMGTTKKGRINLVLRRFI